MGMRKKGDRTDVKDAKVSVRVNKEHLDVLKENRIDIAHLVRNAIERAVKRLKRER